MSGPSLKWWLELHQLVLPMMLASLTVLGLVVATIIIWHWWTWIGENSASLIVMATFVTGLALAIFAWLTYSLSRKMVEVQYAPKLQIYSAGDPKTGKFVGGEAITYEGVQWKFYLLNPGDAPIWVNQISIEITPTSGRLSWTSVHGLYELLDEQNRVLSQEIMIEGHGHIAVTVILHDEKTGEYLQRLYGQRNQFVMAGIMYQNRQFFGRDKSGWLRIVSGRFDLPSKLGKANLII